MALKHCIITLALVGSITAAANNYVVINQVLYDSPWNEVVSRPPYGNGEFIELYNSGTEDVAIGGWILSGSGTTEHYTIPTGYVLSSGGYLIVAYRHASTPTYVLTDLYPVPAGLPILYQNKINLSNQGETITLCNVQNDTIDRMYYDGDSHKTKPTRLYAENEDSIPGIDCASLHRTWAEFDEQGRSIPGTDEWVKSVVSAGTNMLPVNAYYEDYLTGNQSLPTGENYIISVSPLDAASRISYTNGKPSVSNGIRTRTNVQYYDGLGREKQSIGLNQSPTKTDYVTMPQYTGLHRQTKTWLPIAVETDAQPVSEANFISAAQTFYSDNRAYSENTYENSALNRRIASQRPGNAWQNHNKKTTYAYQTNGWNVSVRKYEVLSGGLLGGNSGEQLRCSDDYDDHVLFMQTTTDEDGSSIATFTDKENRLLLERRNGEDTYYVYDRMGLLRYVLPPSCALELTTGTFDMASNVPLRQLAYCYQYDGPGNQIYKRLPGCEPQYMVYDVARQLVLSQDGNQRAANRWTIYGYDSIGRNVYTAEITSTQSHADLITYYQDKWQVEHYAKSAQANALSNTGYASTIMGVNGAKVLTVNYYDTYDFLEKLPTEDKKALKYELRSGYGYQHDNATGLLTGTRTYDLSDNSYIATAYYYDRNGRIIQQRGTRHSGGYEKVWLRYNFDGTIAQKLTEQKNGDDVISEAYSYSYDHAGRTLNVKYKLNDAPEIVLSKYSYDILGRLAQNLRQNNPDTLFYDYDMRGAMTNIRSRTFSERLFYADSLENGLTARYNGNIAAAYITHPDSVYKFAYTYDQHNRLTHAKIYQGIDSQQVSEAFSYDHNGNICTLSRYNGTSLIDDLLFTYQPTSNRLASVADYADPADLTSVKEYHDNHTATLSESDMTYDANGNMVSDADRGISVIKYNLLNLPDTIQFTNGNQIINLYDAAGTKYQTIYYTLFPTIATPYYNIAHYGLNSDTVAWNITEYAGNVENYYSRIDTLRRIFNAEGYIERDTLYCYYRDHLGNNVAVRNMVSDSIVQRTVYYASGLPMAQSTSAGKQPYKYNGKEFVEMHGLDEYDSQARHYYATIMRTTTMDPMAEKYYHLSPYSWCGNNPVNAIDLNGCDTVNVTYNSETEHWDLGNPTIAEGNDVINVTDKDGNTSTYEFSEGEYGKRANFLNLENTGEGGYTFGVYHISGAKEGGTGFYVTPGGEASNDDKSGKRIIEGTYPITKPHDKAEWRYPGVGGDAAVRGCRFHYGYPNPRDWSEGCFILFYDYNLVGGKIKVTEPSTRTAAINFAHLLGGIGVINYVSPKGKNRTGVPWYPYGIDNKLVLK